jgi:hypothetical protein
MSAADDFAADLGGPIPSVYVRPLTAAQKFQADIRAAEEAKNPAFQGGSLSVGPWDTGVKTSPLVDQVLSGGGKALTDLQMGYQQRLGDLRQGPQLVTPQMVDQKESIDAPLMRTRGGQAGNILGSAVATLPLMAVPGVNTVTGAGLVGGLYGGIKPTGANDSIGMNMATNAGLSAAIPGAAAVLRGTKAVAEPFYQGGRDQILGRALDRFSGNDPAVIDALRNYKTYVPGTTPTAAEASGNAGLAALEGGVSNLAPYKQAFQTQQANNNAARAAAVRGVAGDPAQLAALEHARSSKADELYQAAFADAPKPIPQEVTQRPAFMEATKQAHQDALNMGVNPNDPANATQVLHLTKLALDRMSQSADSGFGRAGVLNTRDALLSAMPDSYGAAKSTFAQMSQPINQMEVGQYLYGKMVPALNDFGGTTRTKAQVYADALRQGDATAQRATGFPGAKMDSVMAPEQMQSLNGVAQDLSRRAATEDAMRGVGSNTAQNLATQNILNQSGIPFVHNSVLGNTLARPIAWVANKADENLQHQLARAILDPARTADLISKIRAPAQQPGALADMLRRLGPPMGASVSASQGGQ